MYRHTPRRTVLLFFRGRTDYSDGYGYHSITTQVYLVDCVDDPSNGDFFYKVEDLREFNFHGL